MKVFQVCHNYDVDGGFGDAVRRTEVVAVFENFNDANAFMEKFRNPHVYESPYADLYCGDLRIKETEIISHGEFDINAFHPEDNMWWTPVYERANNLRSFACEYAEVSEWPTDANRCITEEIWAADNEYPAGTCVDKILDDIRKACEAEGIPYDEVVAMVNRDSFTA